MSRHLAAKPANEPPNSATIMTTPLFSSACRCNHAHISICDLLAGQSCCVQSSLIVLQFDDSLSEVGQVRRRRQSYHEFVHLFAPSPSRTRDTLSVYPIRTLSLIIRRSHL
jgi:hypothetical protein